MMCKEGQTRSVRVYIAERYSRTGEARWDDKPIDLCIAKIVEVLNANGVPTVASCCGHGKRLGSIALEDDRELLIAADYEMAREVYRAVSVTGLIDDPTESGGDGVAEICGYPISAKEGHYCTSRPGPHWVHVC